MATESASRIEMRTLSSGSLREFIEFVTGREARWPSQSWNVDQLTLAATYYHPDLVLAGAQADFPDAATITAVLRPNPSITILPTWVNNVGQELILGLSPAHLKFPSNSQATTKFVWIRRNISLKRHSCEYRMGLCSGWASAFSDAGSLRFTGIRATASTATHDSTGDDQTA
ncbi:MAG: hypothetical protein WBO24_14495 [Nitrospirales bacterium]